MDNEFSFQIISEKNEIVCIRLNSGFRSPAHQKALYQKVQDELANGFKGWIIDLAEQPFPTISVMALIIAITVAVRQADGELTLVALQQSAKNNFTTFSPLTFLTVEHSIETALHVLQPGTDQDVQGTRTTISPDEISEPPMVNTFDHRKFLDDETSTIIIEDALDHSEPQRHPSPESDNNHAVESPLISDLIRVDSQSLELYKICDFIVRHARDAGIEDKQVGFIKISVYEACLNVIEHAYHSKPGNSIEVSIEYNSEFFKIVIRDFGLAFRKFQNRTYDVEEAVENRQSGGFGMHIINRSMDEVTYDSDEIDGNRLILKKFLPA